MRTRIEMDSIGALEVPEEVYYGVQSLRANQNVSITGRKLHPEFINSLASIKKAAAIANYEAKDLSSEVADAIISAADEIAAGGLREQFIVDPIQGGAGTSSNMNVNEVIANRAGELLGDVKGAYQKVHPNDHVNMSQSTNDVIPTAGKLTVLSLMPKLIGQLERLKSAFLKKSVEYNDVLKMGRTQLQDAVPMRMGQSFGAYASVIEKDIKRLTEIQAEMRTINMGATAIGTAINVSAGYFTRITPILSEVSGQNLTMAEDLFDATQNLDGFVAVSNALKTCAVSLSKISNDLRLLSCGPRTGIHELNLPAKQNGSSIMPGKVNPVIPEVVSQVAYLVIGHDLTITLAAEAGQLELNAFEPVLFYHLFESIDTMTEAVATLTDNCVKGITVNVSHCKELLNASVGFATALCPHIG